ncbi:DinB superfamily protein [Bremerella volcania]|uniref:DinB superfamily protein n=1 Tax=Bremerella volcania TaxID=2527984 RepID=A0A518CB01_9BACT|nr:DinB family protein [Bremerella volcania]QDU76380.1 DinB superfamily protein [Bremerella volcania]
MSLSQIVFADFDQEIANTRKTLERVPDDKWDWKIHEKSNTIGWVAGHLAEIPGWTASTWNHDQLDMNPPDGPGYQPPLLNSHADALALFDKNVASAKAAIANITEEDLSKPWSLLDGGNVLFTMPKLAVMRTFVINHLVHHRAILTVYFRVNDVPVPALYGPSGDESM